MLERLSWSSARERLQSAKVALIPVGSTEQHGPHLPLGTDFITAQALAQAVARELDVVCTPVIPIGISDHHRQFWGTLWVSPQTFRSYMKEIALSLAYHGIARVIYVNGHGGNNAALQEVCRELRREQVYGIVWPWWLDPDVLNLMHDLFKSRGTHAGASETAIVWAIDHELVDQQQFDEAARGASATFATTKDGALLPAETIDFSRSGATLDPREASADAGRQILRKAQEKLTRIARWLAETPADRLGAQPHI